MGEGKKEEKKDLFPNSIHTRPMQGNSEKIKLKNSRNYKKLFRYYFKPKRDNIGREIEKKILVANSVHT